MINLNTWAEYIDYVKRVNAGRQGKMKAEIAELDKKSEETLADIEGRRAAEIERYQESSWLKRLFKTNPEKDFSISMRYEQKRYSVAQTNIFDRAWITMRYPRMTATVEGCLNWQLEKKRG